MLPQTMWLNKAVEEQLQTLKGKTGVTPNVAARIAFFRSIEKGFMFNKEKDYKLSGSLKLDKFTWLGKTQMVTELLLKQRYPEYSDKELQAAWAAHVEDGIAAIRNYTNLLNLTSFV
ncbi:DNA sulfur modification protein DndE [Pseudoalteromonas sp. CST5]|uniref:DNA sulfur modification protein DndE n=1 Tax=unclassified Pseudoalteromonas TaxID=194690 RepID=UPI0023591E98|nr:MULTISPECIES: DNA sulfur modification protein DndE [unclassified Pseudoalteromonas]MDC9512481.1 DNA sulfur modification protein DndE [Pseudoalteromonas sp. CST1]MDC9536717.1 DNA sulfur modification protein DndE [Pseudoalteromonas sp. CST3]MDC9540749.1 DNA sulfur modification protein DndE [Pseudoalteromonas sp. CST2]MDC9545424.1 DNA sulfur modification protein DndE [Pseudoalteromonas sp. CST4]MDC9549911.1 DNA sulfur modification protein DndE [Pseudoalteromonas sp. CST5]